MSCVTRAPMSVPQTALQPNSYVNFDAQQTSSTLLPVEVIDSVMQYLPAHDVIQSSFASYPLTLIANKIIRARLSFLDEYSLRVFAKDVYTDSPICDLSARRGLYSLQYDGYSVFHLDPNNCSSIFQISFEDDEDLASFERYPGEFLAPHINVRIHVTLSRSSCDRHQADIFSCFQDPIRVRRDWLDSIKPGQPETLWFDQNTQHVIGLIVTRVDAAPGKYDLSVTSVIVQTEYLLSCLEKRVH